MRGAIIAIALLALVSLLAYAASVTDGVPSDGISTINGGANINVGTTGGVSTVGAAAGLSDQSTNFVAVGGGWLALSNAARSGSNTWTLTDQTVTNNLKGIWPALATNILGIGGISVSDVDGAWTIDGSGVSGGGGNGISLTGKWTAVKSVAWMGWQAGVGSTVSNGLVPFPFVINDATNSIVAEGFFTDLPDMQDIFAYAICTWPPYATNWADTAIVIRIIGDATSIITSKVDLVFMDGIQSFTTNNLVPNSTTAYREYEILKTELPTSWTNFPIMTLHSNMIVRGDFFTTTSKVIAVEIDFNLK